MRKIVIALLISLPLFAGFFPNTVYTTVSKATQDSISLKKPFPVQGMSGVIIHKYSEDLKAITHRLVQPSHGKVNLLKGDIIHHDSLPTINTSVKRGDKVIGGYLYHNILLFAPDAKTYARVTSRYHKNWIHPDIFALFLANEGDTVPTKENLKIFAKRYQVGLIAIITHGKLKLLDPISGYTLKQKSLRGLPPKGQSPFFMRFEKIDAGWFSKNTKNNYYSIMDTL
ncbi:MAG: plasminogen-binding N-terminal domain-containing protein [Sulfurovum sp.]|nr:plasminogen-binding N-terminal domain-containing protein [Sulfurovum sp.]